MKNCIPHKAINDFYNKQMELRKGSQAEYQEGHLTSCVGGTLVVSPLWREGREGGLPQQLGIQLSFTN